MAELPEGVSEEVLENTRETAKKIAAKLVHTAFATYLRSIGQKKLERLVMKECPVDGITSITLKLNEQYSLVLLLVLVEHDYKIEIYLPPIGLNDEQFDAINKLIHNAIRDIKMMAIVYFATWIKATPLASKINAVCGDVYYGMDQSNGSYVRLYKAEKQVGEKLLIGVGSYYLDNGQALFPTFGPLAGRGASSVDSQPPKEQ